MVEKGFRGGICHAIHRYVKANSKFMENYNKGNGSSYIQYLDANNLYGWAMSQTFPVNGFEWVKEISSLNKSIKLINNYDEDSDKGYIFEVDIDYPKDLHDLHIHLPFLPERKRINECNKLVCNLYDKKTMLFT